MRNDRELGALYAQRAPAREPGSCPDADELWAAATLAAPVERRSRVADHLGRCPECSTIWQVTWAIAADERRRLRRWYRWQMLGKIAAAVLVAVGLWIVGAPFVERLTSPAGDPDVVRGVTRGEVVAIGSEGGEVGELRASEPVLAWRWVPAVEPRDGVAEAEPVFQVAVCLPSAAGPVTAKVYDLTRGRLDLRDVPELAATLETLSAGDEILWTVTVRVMGRTERQRTFRSRWVSPGAAGASSEPPLD